MKWNYMDVLLLYHELNKESCIVITAFSIKKWAEQLQL